MQSVFGISPVIVIAGLASAAMMIRAGVAKNMIVLRHQTRPCPACGRKRTGTVCAWCSGH